MKFLVYEIWSRAQTVEADTVEEAYDKAEPKPRSDMVLANWHAIPLDSNQEGPSGSN